VIGKSFFINRIAKAVLSTSTAVAAGTIPLITYLTHPPFVTGPQSFAGLMFGGVRGHRFVGVVEYIQDAMGAKRVDADWQAALEQYR